MSGRIAAPVLVAVAERDGGWLCSYCGTELARLLPGTRRRIGAGPAPQRDHVHPRFRGGADDLDNIVLACGLCNASKGTRTLLAFLVHRAAA